VPSLQRRLLYLLLASTLLFLLYLLSTGRDEMKMEHPRAGVLLHAQAQHQQPVEVFDLDKQVRLSALSFSSSIEVCDMLSLLWSAVRSPHV
jgi:hypothetical protein